MLFHGRKYVDRHGRSIFLLDRTQGLPLLIDTVRLFFKDIRLKTESIAKSILPRQNATGTYIWRNGKLVKVSGKTNVLDIWFHKHKERPDQGDREYHNFMYNQCQKGKLNDVDDRVCWEESIRKYGRGKVEVGY